VSIVSGSPTLDLVPSVTPVVTPSLAWPHPLLQRREGVCIGTRLTASYSTGILLVLVWIMDPDTTMRKSMRMYRNSSLDFSCAPTYDSARGFNSFSVYYTRSPFTPRNLPTHRSHQLSCD